MKIVLIHGQTHKGTTYHMGRTLAEKLTDNKNVTEFFLPRDLNHFCVGCYSCIEDETRCPWWEEKSAILNALRDADLFIFTSPNYCMAPSAAMKTFLDLMFDYWMVHKPKEFMFKKRAVVLSASAGASCADVVKTVKKSLLYWGVPYVKSYALPVHAMNWEVMEDKTKQKIIKKLNGIAKKIDCKKPPRIGIKTRFLFFIMGMLHKKGWDSSPTEKEYWEERGWLKNKKPW